MIAQIVDSINHILWGYLLIYLLLGAGVYFTLRLKFVQIVRLPEMVRTLATPPRPDAAGITPFQALCTSLAARVGTGNIAGVAVALYLGGPGATFWMWLVAALGMATAFAESTLAQLFKVRDTQGRYRGGPAFYIANGLKAPRAAALFSICLIISFGLVFNAVQANSIAEAMHEAFHFDRLWTGVAVAVFAGLVIFGGIRAIARFAEVVVPFMAAAYLAVAVYALVVNASAVPGMLKLIVTSAFGYGPAVGGLTGAMTAAVLNGVKRGMFSNEAGIGSAPNIAAVATPNPHHPCSQGFVQALGVFIDTLVICTSTALLILLSGKLAPGSGVTGITLTQEAMHHHLGAWGGWFVAVAILFFAYTSIIGNYSYAEGALVYLRCDGRTGKTVLRLGLIAMVVWGATQQVTTVFDVADMSMGFMALINISAILMLSGPVARLTSNYVAQRKEGRSPVFSAGQLPELAGKIDADIWSVEAADEAQAYDRGAAA